MDVRMCVCCGKQPGATSEMVAIASTPLPETMPEALRGSLLEDEYNRMREARMKAPPIRVGFCSMCDHAGCDGESPCNVPAEQWESMERHKAEQEEWDKARGFPVFAWRDPAFRQELIAATPENWTQLADNYWRRLERTEKIVLLGEILKMHTSGRYHAYVTVLESDDPGYQGTATGAEDEVSLQEAEETCDRLAKLYIEGRAQKSVSYTIPHTTLEDT